MSRFRLLRAPAARRCVQQEAADVDHAVLLGRHGAAVGQANISRAISIGRPVGVARLPQLDEVGVLGEAAGVEEERDAVLAADGA